MKKWDFIIILAVISATRNGDFATIIRIN